MKLVDICEQDWALRNQHDLRKKAMGYIKQAKRILAQKSGTEPNAQMVADFVSRNARNASREELAAVRSLLGLS